MKKRMVLAVQLTMLLLMPTSACGWEADVHYGLTKWLAIQVGYSERQATLIAEGDQGIDDSLITGPIFGTVIASCVGNDPAGSVTVHNNHFPSQSYPPNPPATRRVEPRKIWEDGVVRQAPKVDGSDAAFLALGRYLHTLQDSWSHQGEPDVPPFCNPALGWGHALARGGWSCHLADLTYRWKDSDVPAMAEATYNELRYAMKNKPASRWQMLKSKVDAFAAAQTKWKKDEWFKQEKFSDRAFLQGISLPDCESAKSCSPYPYDKLIEQWKQITARDRHLLVDIPGDVARLFKDFFSGLARQWLSTLRFEIIDESLAAAALARYVHVDSPCPDLYRVLFPFLLGDGFSDGRGAHQPQDLCEMAIQLGSKRKAISCSEAVSVARKAIGSAPPRGPGLKTLEDKIKPTTPFAYTVTPTPRPTTYLAFGQFVHLPRNLLVVRAEKKDDRPRITGFVWLPSE